MELKLIVISSVENIKDEINTVIQLFENELEYFHLRKPELPEEELRKYITRIPEEFHSRIIIHSHFNLIYEFNLKGIHFNKKNIKTYWNKFNNIKRHKSVSCHSFDEVLTIFHKNKKKFDYVFLSPVFDSISKKGYKSSFSEDSIRNFFKENPDFIGHKIIALGGINEYNVEKTLQIGFGGVAICGVLWENFKETRNINKILLTFKKIKEKCQ